MVRLLPNDRIPNKDFMLSYTVAGEKMQPVALTHRKPAQSGFFQLILLPKLSVSDKEIFPRELVFVVDNSGSMSGMPMEKCKEIMRHCLTTMRKDDVFRLIKFAGSTDILSQKPLSATSENVSRALAFVDDMRGGGGTEMLKAIWSVFDTPELPSRKRIVLFMTDGYIGNEKEIIATINERLGNTRVFSLGVGSSVNRYLLEGMAYCGRGVCTILRHDGDAKEVTRSFYSTIEAPVLTDITLKMSNVYLVDRVPQHLPDLFAGQPLVFTAKYEKAGKGTITIQGKLPNGKAYRNRLDITLPGRNPENSVLSTLWARKRIRRQAKSGALE